MIAARSIILASAESLSAETVYPGYRLDLGDTAVEVTFIVDIQSLSGSPTTASLTAEVQAVMPHTTGNEFLTERVFSLSDGQAAALAAEGSDWPSPLCDQDTTYPATVQRTYRGFGKDLRLVLTPAFTGGTSPAFVISVVAHAKG